MLSTFISRDAVVKKIIKLRCRYAAEQAEFMQQLDFVHYGDTSEKKNRCVYRLKNDRIFIYNLFPQRKYWCHIGKRRITLDSTKRNEKKLYYTYCKAVKKNSQARWFLNLCDFADSIIHLIENPGNSLPKPNVMVIEKERNQEEIICRPVCSFPLKIKIALSLINSVLTSKFDEIFYSCSYAFRTPTPERGQFQHLNAVKEIKKYRIEHLGMPLYVAECDMQKFYDTIDHNIIKIRYNQLLRIVKYKNLISSQEYKILKQWMYNYIDCFDFYNDVYRYNYVDSNHQIWKTIKNKGNLKCRIKWVKNFFVNGKCINKKKRGVPQGGALSGLIANIVMHYVDRNVLEAIGDNDVKYFRFCDDMVIMGVDELKVNNVFLIYNDSVRKSHLFPHENLTINLTHMREFWNGKTRGPYKWGEKGTDVYPWITFVGFDCNWNGNLRIRKSSLRKEIKKQFTLVDDFVKMFYRRGCFPRYSLGTMKNSLISRLIGMSVGRIDLRNYKKNLNIHSWMSAFSILDKNQWSEEQLRLLDRHRNLMVYKSLKKLSLLNCPNLAKNTMLEKGCTTTYIGKPFSYYGQCLDYK